MAPNPTKLYIVVNNDPVTGSGSGEDSILSAEEVSLLQLIVNGDSNTSIARKMRLDARQTRYRICLLFSKMKVADRIDAAVAAMGMMLPAVNE